MAIAESQLRGFEDAGLLNASELKHAVAASDRYLAARDSCDTAYVEQIGALLFATMERLEVE